MTGLRGDAGEIADDGNGGFLRIMISAGGSVKGWGGRDARFLLNEAGQQMSELFRGGLSAWIDQGLGDA